MNLSPHLPLQALRQQRKALASLSSHADVDGGFRIPLIWVGYLSSTGVYGDWGGEWVDER